MRGVDLFCGAGGFAWGMKEAGVNIVCSIDFNSHALAVHEHNLDMLTRRIGVPFVRPVRTPVNATEGKARGSSIRGFAKDGKHQTVDLLQVVKVAPDIAALKPDIIFGGPPCQPYSRAGEQRGDEDERSLLTEAFAVIVAAARPRYFLMENVPQVRKSLAYQRAISLLKHAGYGVTEEQVNAADFGVPQARKRLIVAGCLDAPAGWFKAHLREQKADREQTVADVLGPDFGARLADLVIDSADAVPGGAGYNLRERDIKKLRDADQATRLYHWPPGGVQSGCIYRTDQPSPTILTKGMPGVVKTYVPATGDPIDLRQLPTPDLAQLSLLGGFPRHWRWERAGPEGYSKSGAEAVAVSRTAASIMIGNAVPPPLAAALGRAVRSHDQGRIVGEPARQTWRGQKKYASWLRSRLGYTADAVRQVMSDTRAAKGLLVTLEVESAVDSLKAIEALPAFKAKSTTRKSQLRRALRVLAMYEDFWGYVRAGLIDEHDPDPMRSIRQMKAADDADCDDDNPVAPGLANIRFGGPKEAA